MKKLSFFLYGASVWIRRYIIIPSVYGWYSDTLFFPCPRLRSIPNLPRASCVEVAELTKFPIHPLGTLLSLAGHTIRIGLLGGEDVQERQLAGFELLHLLLEWRQTPEHVQDSGNHECTTYRAWRSRPAITWLAVTRLPWLFSWARLGNLLMGDWFFSWYS
jgi:hypothetical protein